jgi:hypothetical protein
MLLLFALRELQLLPRFYNCSPQAVGDVAPVVPFVVKPVGQGTHARCFFKPGL